MRHVYKHLIFYFIFSAASLAVFTTQIAAQSLTVRSVPKPGDFTLASKNKTATVYVSSADAKVVKIAANDFAADVERVTVRKPDIKDENTQPGNNAIFIGTLGKNYLIDKMVQSGKLDVSRIGDKWESYLIAVVKNPMPGVANGLVIAGSDRRGTAYGVYELSQMIGVSPWYWWADVAPEHKDALYLSPGRITGGEPSVKYRGIFLNDEDWGLQPWAAKTFEPEVGNIGPKTYAKIFELLLRLKANTVWPAMHEVTKPFNSIPGNAQTADDYAIVMGSSHAEPMLRNNVGEWKDAPENYDYKKNPDGVEKYWEDRVAANGKFENIYTLGMRGIHDSPIQSVKTQAERIPLLENIFDFQRSLLAKYVNEDPKKVPQIFCPYKEVLADYRAGLKVPDDVTIVFPDDNFGYIRQFPTAEEQKRSGGFGVYYHISYLGRPLSYLWLETTPPAQIWEEMSKAYDHNMRNFWIVNVGDLKPGEIGTEFFLQMAWDMKHCSRDNLNDYLKVWAAREFGAKNSAQIADIMEKYYKLNFQRKPEHLQWNIPNETTISSRLSEDEIDSRLEDFAELESGAAAIYATLPKEKKDAFYQLVLYPVRMSHAANERVFAVELATRFLSTKNNWFNHFVSRARDAQAQISTETAYFNNELSGGKWRGIMSPEMGAGQWPSMRSTPPPIPEAMADVEIQKHRTRVKNFAIEGSKSEKIVVESNGVISIEAEHFTKKADVGNIGWQVIPGLGRRGDSVAVFPTTAKSVENPTAQNSPHMEYNFFATSEGDFDLTCYLLPTQPIVAGTGLRYAVGIDNEQPQIVTVDKDVEVSSRKWSFNVMNASTSGTNKIHLTGGSRVLKIYMVDAGIVMDYMVIDTGGLKRSYLGPPETGIVK
jgi:hypothetical protein